MFNVNNAFIIINKTQSLMLIKPTSSSTRTSGSSLSPHHGNIDWTESLASPQLLMSLRLSKWKMQDRESLYNGPYVGSPIGMGAQTKATCEKDLICEPQGMREANCDALCAA